MKGIDWMREKLRTATESEKEERNSHENSWRKFSHISHRKSFIHSFIHKE